MENTMNKIPFADKSPEEIAQGIISGLQNGSVSMDDFIVMLSTVINANKQSQNAGVPANVPQVPVGPVAQPVAPMHQRFQARHAESLMRDTIDDFIEKNKYLLILPDMLDNTNGILDYIHDEILDSYETTRQMLNTNVEKGAKTIPPINKFRPENVTDLLIGTGEVKRLAGSANSKGTKLICKHYFKNESTGWKYKWSGQWEVINDDENSPLASIYRRLAPMSANALLTTMKSLRCSADLVYMRTDDTLTFWRNGVYDLANQRFMSYDDPAYDATYGKYITLRKCHTNHPCGAPWGKDPVCKIDPNTGKAVEPVINEHGHTWHAMEGLTAPFKLGTTVGDASLKVILQAAQFMLRGRGGNPGMFHFWINYGCNGGNGKGFTASLYGRVIQKNPEEFHDGDEDLLRSDAIGHKSVEELGTKFQLTPESMLWMMNAADETNTTKQGAQIEDVATIKKLGRKEYITIEAKFKDAMEICLSYVWFIQMCNNMPHISEKNGSVKNAIVAIPFEVPLGRTRPWIMDNYIRREEVASYYAWYLTCECPMWDGYDQTALDTLAPFKETMLENSMVTLRYFKDLCESTEMDVIPMEYAFSLYPGWAEENGVNYQPDLNQFCIDAKQFGMDNKHGVYFTDKRVRMTPADRKDYTSTDNELFITSLRKWGKSSKHKSNGGYSKFQMDCVSGTYSEGVRPEWKGKLKSSEVEDLVKDEFGRIVKDSDGNYKTIGKHFNRGAFVRIVSHRKESIVPENDQEELIYDDGMQTAS